MFSRNVTHSSVNQNIEDARKSSTSVVLAMIGVALVFASAILAIVCTSLGISSLSELVEKTDWGLLTVASMVILAGFIGVTLIHKSIINSPAKVQNGTIVVKIGDYRNEILAADKAGYDRGHREGEDKGLHVARATEERLKVAEEALAQATKDNGTTAEADLTPDDETNVQRIPLRM